LGKLPAEFLRRGAGRCYSAALQLVDQLFALPEKTAGMIFQMPQNCPRFPKFFLTGLERLVKNANLPL
jgi:hypothetical protein